VQQAQRFGTSGGLVLRMTVFRKFELSTSHQLLWCIDSLVLRNPPLRQAPDRWQQA